MNVTFADGLRWGTCPTCHETGDLNRHSCKPSWGVRWLEYEVDRIVFADTAQCAAEKAVELWEDEDHDFVIGTGRCVAVVTVHGRGDNAGVIETFEYLYSATARPVPSQEIAA